MTSENLKNIGICRRIVGWADSLPMRFKICCIDGMGKTSRPSDQSINNRRNGKSMEPLNPKHNPFFLSIVFQMRVSWVTIPLAS